MAMVAKAELAKLETDPVRTALADPATYAKLVVAARRKLRAAGDMSLSTVLTSTAEELVSRASAIAIEKRSHHDPSRGKVTTWFCGILTTLIRERKSKTERNRGGPYSQVDAIIAKGLGPDEQAMSQCESQRLRTAIAKLDPLQQQLLHGRFYDDVTDEVQANRMGLSKVNVRVRIHRAIEELRTMMAIDAEGQS